MPQDQLFLIEILVDSIYFLSADNVPQKKHIYIVANWTNIASLEIRNDGLGGGDESSKSKEMEFASGKSYLFSCSSDKVLKSFTLHPLEIVVWKKDNPVPIGTALVNWTSDFVQMVDSCDGDFGYVTPVTQRDLYIMKDQYESKTGDLEVFIRLSCFGNNITTQFQVVKQKDPKDGTIKSQFLYKSPNAATTFQCQRYGIGTSMDNIPIGAILNPTDLDDKLLKTFFTDPAPGPPGSVMPSAFNLDQFIQQHFNKNVADDQLSIMFRMDNKFITLADLLDSATSRPDGVFVVPDEELTVENINNLLCKDRDCPAAKLFKEYGIGPLATTKNLGTIYGTVDPPVTYGMSHANGTMEHYGPLGVYRKPKRVDQDFYGKPTKTTKPSKDSSKSSIDSGRSICSCQKVLRLKGGATEKNEALRMILNNEEYGGRKNTVAKKTKQGVSKSSIASGKKPGKHKKKRVLRLKGGAPIEDRKDPSPLTACKSLMDNFDQLVKDYKKALGPCGQATCPFAQNIIDQSCRAFCPGGFSDYCPPVPTEMMVEKKAPDASSISSCGANTCPYARLMQQPVEPEVKLKQVTPACGEPTCPYAKKRLGIIDDDVDEAMVQMTKLPPNCGAPTCPYKVEEPLPPIHWDCPDPLPKGVCKNPNCPILKEQGFVGQMYQASTAPCQAPECPYAMPPPCDVVGCPFGPPAPCVIPGCPYSTIPPCTDPNCPINEEILNQDREVCKDPRCPFFKPPIEDSCTDPACPYNKAKQMRFSAPDDSGRRGPVADEGPQAIIETCPCASAPSALGAKPTSAPQEGDVLKPGATEFVRVERIEPCTPYTCSGKGGSLECLICGTEIATRDAGGPTEVIKVSNIEPCTPYTCMATGGSLECLECPCKTGTAAKKYKTISDHKPKKVHSDGTTAKKRKKKSKYVLDSGDTYPGVKIGHRYCVTPALNVPHNMGWLWNIKPVGNLRPRRGWKPGALTKKMIDTIEEHRAKCGVKPLIPPTSKPSKKKMRKNAYGVYESDSDVSVPPKPTLQIKKKDGCYLITMNPLKDPYKLEENENPYMECTPMMFKISKNKPPVQIQPGEEDDFCSCADDHDAKSSSNSELDIEFTPPAGIIHPERFRKKKNVVHQDTQYNVDDIPKEDKEDGKGGKKKGKKGGKKGKGDKKGGKGKGKKK